MTAKKAFTEEVEGANFNLILNTSNDKFIYDDIDIGRDTYRSQKKLSKGWKIFFKFQLKKFK